LELEALRYRATALHNESKRSKSRTVVKTFLSDLADQLLIALAPDQSGNISRFLATFEPAAMIRWVVHSDLGDKHEWVNKNKTGQKTMKRESRTAHQYN
jgi:hypothetical protein